MTRFTAFGKEVLRDGEHFADAIDETAAADIAGALNHQAFETERNMRLRREWGVDLGRDPDISEGLAEK